MSWKHWYFLPYIEEREIHIRCAFSMIYNLMFVLSLEIRNVEQMGWGGVWGARAYGEGHGIFRVWCYMFDTKARQEALGVGSVVSGRSDAVCGVLRMTHHLDPKRVIIIYNPSSIISHHVIIIIHFSTTPTNENARAIINNIRSERISK